MMPAVFVTGTDTEVGKTHVTCGLLDWLRRSGYRAIGMKPVAAGAVRTDEGLRNEDALALLARSVPAVTYEVVNPYVFEDPTSPDIAARRANTTIRPERILAAYDTCRDAADVVIVEGIGGWRVPLAARVQTADVVRAMRIPVVLVCGIRLGCINHGVLSAEVIRADGCELLGWIANIIDPAYAYADDAIATLGNELPAPLLGRVDFSPGSTDIYMDTKLEATLQQWWPQSSPDAGGKHG